MPCARGQGCSPGAKAAAPPKKQDPEVIDLNNDSDSDRVQEKRKEEE